MEKDRYIGRVLNVDSFRVLIEIDKENKSLTKTHYCGIYPVARINSYVIIPVGYEKIVGHITKVQMFTEANESPSKATVTLPDVKRLVWVTMIGTIKKQGDSEFYEQGITSFPSLDNPVCFILKDELDIIFDKKTEFTGEDSNKKNYYVSIGKSTAFDEYEVKVDPDALFSKHLAILGNTGSGKSCTIASLIQTLLKGDYAGSKVTNAHFIILDTNGEYASAFTKLNGAKEKISSIGERLVINKDGLKIPYWFMNLEDFRTIFRATEGSQAPVLNDAVTLAKNLTSIDNPLPLLVFLNDQLRQLCSIVSDQNKDDYRKTQDLQKKLSDCLPLINENIVKIKGYCDKYSFNYQEKILDKLNTLNGYFKLKQGKTYYENITAQQLYEFTKFWEENQTEFEKLVGAFKNEKNSINVDAPVYFPLSGFIEKYLSTAMNIQGRENSRIREYCSTLILRMNSFFNDDRYKILFDDYANFPNALSTFLRYCFGRMEKAKFDKFNGTEKPPFLDYYFNEIAKKEGMNHQVIIFDMSLLASDILENITALLGRLILEFLQRLGKERDKRGSFPIVLVLEEAHNYIPERQRSDEKDSISKKVFERIAREGRKFGLSLIVSSQRPSELSKTVLSQCNSFIVHRIQNPEDQKYIQTIVPSINEDLLRQLPSLAQRTALIFGDCVRAPAQLYMNKADPLPDSKDPKFMKHWLKLDKDAEPDFENICSEWEKHK